MSRSFSDPRDRPGGGGGSDGSGREAGGGGIIIGDDWDTEMILRTGRGGTAPLAGGGGRSLQPRGSRSQARERLDGAALKHQPRPRNPPPQTQPQTQSLPQPQQPQPQQPQMQQSQQPQPQPQLQPQPQRHPEPQPWPQPHRRDGSSGRMAADVTGSDPRSRRRGRHRRQRGSYTSMDPPSAVAGPGATAAAAAEDAGWEAEWELEWEVWRQRRGDDGGGGGGRAGARLPLSALLPGHAATAAATAARPAVALPPSTAGLMFSPIAPPGYGVGPSQSQNGLRLTGQDVYVGQRTSLPRQPLTTANGSAPPAPHPASGAGRSPVMLDATVTPTAIVATALPPPSPTSSAAAQPSAAERPAMQTRCDTRGAVVTAASATAVAPAAVAPEPEAEAAAEVLAAVVNDAAVVRPDAWSDTQIAALLRSAAKLAYRYPELLTERQPRPAAREWSAPPPPPAAQPHGRAFEREWSAGGVSVGSSGASLGGGGGAAPNSAGASTAVQLRVGLQQLLLRLDGMLGGPRRPRRKRVVRAAAARTASAHRAASAAPAASSETRASAPPASHQAAQQGAKARRGAAPAAAPPPDALPPAMAAAAVWAAAALRLRLSPGGRVRRRVMAAFRPSRLRGRGVGRRGLPRRVQLGARRSAELPPVRPGALAEALWGMATLGMKVPMPWLDAALCALTARRRRRRPGARPAAAAAVAAAAAMQRAPPSGDGGVESPGGGGVCGKESAAAGGTGVPGGGGGLASLSAVQLCNLARGVVELSSAGGREAVTRAWAGPLLAATQGRLARLSPSQLADLLWSVARGRRKPTGQWSSAAAAALAAAVPRMVPWQLARTASALAKLRLLAPYQLVASMLASLRRRLTAATPADVAAIVWALRFITLPYTQAFVRTHLRDLLDLAAATLPCLPALAPAQLVQLADGWAHLGLLPGVEWMRAHREACIRLRNRFTEANRRKIRQAYVLMMDIM